MIPERGASLADRLSDGLEQRLTVYDDEPGRLIEVYGVWCNVCVAALRAGTEVPVRFVRLREHDHADSFPAIRRILAPAGSAIRTAALRWRSLA
jgi:hypothetical protein